MMTEQDAVELLKTVEELGLGACMVGWFDEKKVRQLLGVPKNKRIPLLITIGHSDDAPREKVRKTTDEICSRNRY